jgi:hypothetical protein
MGLMEFCLILTAFSYFLLIIPFFQYSIIPADMNIKIN